MNCRMYPGADCNADHQLLMSTLGQAALNSSNVSASQLVAAVGVLLP